MVWYLQNYDVCAVGPDNRMNSELDLLEPDIVAPIQEHGRDHLALPVKDVKIFSLHILSHLRLPLMVR